VQIPQGGQQELHLVRSVRVGREDGHVAGGWVFPIEGDPPVRAADLRPGGMDSDEGECDKGQQ
jgi:hypothetical protein